MKLIHYLVIGLILSSGGLMLLRSVGVIHKPTEQEKHQARLQDLARDRYGEEIERAKAENKTTILLPAAFGMPSTVTTVDQVMRDYSLLRVKVIDRETAINEPDADIKTWYKVKILEALHQQDKISDKPLFDGVPSRFLPLLPSESILIVSGGEIIVDGVRVIRAISSDEVDYMLNEEYLIASGLDYGGKVIFPIALAAGVFRVENTSLKPLGHKEHRLVHEMEEMYGNDVNRFRSDIELRQQMREK